MGDETIEMLSMLDRVVEAAAHMFSVTVEEMKASGRSSAVLEARFAAALVLRDMGYSTPKIGQVMARDHTTIIHAIGRGKRLKATSADFAQRLGVIRYLAEQAYKASGAYEIPSQRDIDRQESRRHRLEVERIKRLASERRFRARAEQREREMDEVGCYGVTYRDLVASHAKLLRQLEIYHADMRGV